jgi:hypothetical protein
MLLGLFLRREWVTSIRSQRLFSHRRNSAAMMVLIVGVTFLIWDWRGMDRASVSGAARFGNWLFGLVMAAEAMLAFMVASTLAPAIAAERDRKSLDALLAARLTSAEFVLGNLSAGFLRYLNSAAATVPVVVLVVTLGGVDPRLVLLAFACLASMTFSMAAFSIAISAGARTAARAANAAVGYYLLWQILPWLVVALKPRLWPGGPRWLVDVSLLMLDGSPMGLWMNVMGAMPRPGSLLGAVLWLAGCQVVAGLVLIAWAIARLRPASRAVYDREGRISVLRSLREAIRRPYPRPACGDDPVLWNDLYTLRGPSRLARFVGRLLGLGSIVALLVGTSWFAGPAFSELGERGYSASREAFQMPEFNPFVRVLISKTVLKFPLDPQVGQARLEFNIAIRQISAMIACVYALGILGAVAKSVVTERRRDTWLGLIATPLSGREILGAKLHAAIIYSRETAFLMIGLWAIGLAAGALHPLGFLAGLISLSVCAGSSAALGLANISGHLSAESSKPVVGAVEALVGVGMFFLLMGVPPLMTYASLLSFEDVQALAQGGLFPQFGRSRLVRLLGARGVLGAWFLTATVFSILAVAITRSRFRGFDAAVGRPTRRESPETRGGLALGVVPAAAEA